MSICLRKIFKLGSSSYPMPTTIMASTKTQVYNIASPQIPTLNTRLVKYFCTDRTNADSSKPEDGSDNKNEFLKWDNGGGSFHESAVIHRTAVVECGAVVHSAALVGENAIIASGAIVGPAVEIGQSTRLGYNVSLANCTIGDNCIIHNGVCIGQDGFGFYMDEEGNMVKKPQLLKVKIGNHVEIGANTCIDRGSWRNTIIGDHTKIDNLVQIGHNVQIGNKCLICGQVGIAGSVTIGDCVTMGGRVAIRDHVCIASKVRLAANSLVTKDINEPGDFGGFPAMPIGKWRRLVAAQLRSLK